MSEFGCDLETCGIDTCGDGLACNCRCHKTEAPATEGQRLPIDRPCSACSAGDYTMEYHLHYPPFRKEATATAQPALNELLEKARHHVMTDKEKQAQRESWMRGEMALGEYERGMTTRFRPIEQAAQPDYTNATLKFLESGIWQREPANAIIRELIRRLRAEQAAPVASPTVEEVASKYFPVGWYNGFTPGGLSDYSRDQCAAAIREYAAGLEAELENLRGKNNK